MSVEFLLHEGLAAVEAEVGAQLVERRQDLVARHLDLIHWQVQSMYLLPTTPLSYS